MKKFWNSDGYQSNSVVEMLNNTVGENDDGDLLGVFVSPNSLSEFLLDYYHPYELFKKLPFDEQVKIYGEFCANNLKELLDYGETQITSQEDELFYRFIMQNEHIKGNEELALELLSQIKGKYKLKKQYDKDFCETEWYFVNQQLEEMFGEEKNSKKPLDISNKI